MIELHHGDCLEVLESLPENSIDAIVTDPPYELGFMGKSWDASGIAFCPDTWRLAWRVLKPGGHLVAFGAPKNYHRLACAIEDAGFEIRDSLMWVTGQGFPKSKNLDGDWSGWGTALKPAYEPIVLARKPLSEGTVAANVLRWGTGALNIDATRVENAEYDPNIVQRQKSNRETWEGGVNSGFRADHVQQTYNTAGRWPANLCHDGSLGVLDLFPQSKSGKAIRRNSGGNTFGGDKSKPPMDDMGYGDEGSAARFFYCAKASKQDRAGSKHPTVKPINLMRWLVRMVTPPGGVVLDCFAGSGSTGTAIGLEGMRGILIEREKEYIEDIKIRLGL